nr:DUF4123 domain-containing protein [Citrobacter tructae]
MDNWLALFDGQTRYQLEINDSRVSADVLKFRGREALNEPFRWRIEFTSSQDDVAAEDVLMKYATLRMLSGRVVLESLTTGSELLKLYVLVDGIQYERAYGEPIEESKAIRSLLCLPEDKLIAFAGPWLMEVDKISSDKLLNIFMLEKKYPAVSWIISEQEFLQLTNHLISCLVVTFPSKETGLFRFYDCRVLKMLSKILLPLQIENLMRFTHRWLFLSETNISYYQYNDAKLSQIVLKNENKEVL